MQTLVTRPWDRALRFVNEGLGLFGNVIALLFKPCFIALIFVQGMIILLVIAGSLLRLSVFPSLDVNNVVLAEWPG